MVDPVAVVDDRGKILEVTQKFEEISGYTRQELVGKNVRLLIASAETKPIMLRNLSRQMLGTQMSPYEVEMLTKNGEKLAYEINAAKIDFKRKPADILVFHDLSARKKLEEKLRFVGSLTRHDVRNKLTVIAGNSYLLRRRLAGDPNALRQLEDIDAAVRRVEKIFDFARTYERLGSEELAYVDMKQVLKEAESLFSDLKGIEIVNACNGVTVLADSLLSQVFYNLIENSFKYGEKIKQIRVYYEDEGNQLKLIYKDDGVGISDDMRSSLFKAGGAKGAEYGLFMVKKICEVYGWTIEETGKQGKGTQFTMIIPRKNRAGKTLYARETQE
jgi:PAS domain S-box-containing protein